MWRPFVGLTYLMSLWTVCVLGRRSTTACGEERSLDETKELGAID
jgi:hypothetical protein